MLQELAGVRGGAKAAAKPAAGAAGKPAPKPAAQATPKSAATNGNGHAVPKIEAPKVDFKIGTRIKYHDGSAWIHGVVESIDPAVLSLEDKSEIRTSLEVLQAGAAEGLIVGM